MAPKAAPPKVLRDRPGASRRRRPTGPGGNDPFIPAPVENATPKPMPDVAPVFRVQTVAATLRARRLTGAGAASISGSGSDSTTRGFRPRPIFFASSCRLAA